MDDQKSIINLYQNNNEKSKIISKIIQKKFSEEGFEISLEHNPKAELNLCIGGDGAFLRAVHKSRYSPIPFVGINTGHLGFYQEILIPNIDTFIQNFIHYNYDIEQLDLVECCLYFTDGKEPVSHRALNEFAVKTTDNSIIHLEVYIDENHLQSFAGDALLISTPSGSTAYNFSAGGSILYQSLKGFQLTPLAPLNSKAYRSLLNSIVLPSDAALRFKQGREERNSKIDLLIDGVSVVYDNIDYLEFRASDTYINKIVFDKNWYWMNIKDKFL